MKINSFSIECIKFLWFNINEYRISIVDSVYQTNTPFRVIVLENMALHWIATDKVIKATNAANYEFRSNILDAIILRGLNRNSSNCHSRVLGCHSRRYKLEFPWIVIFIIRDNYSIEKTLWSILSQNIV